MAIYRQGFQFLLKHAEARCGKGRGGRTYVFANNFFRSRQDFHNKRRTFSKSRISDQLSPAFRATELMASPYRLRYCNIGRESA